MATLRLVSWNVNGLDTTRLDSRMEGVCLELLLGIPLKDAMAGKPSPPMPEVIALQEVVRRSHLAQLRKHFGAAGFTLYPDSPPREEGEYSMLAVRAPWRFESVGTEPFEYSALGRTFIEAELSDGASRVRVLTGHLESSRSGADDRVAQAVELDARLHAEATPAVFAGDTNLRIAEWREARARGVRALDAFDEAGAPSAHRDTWWAEESGRGMRFDRVWLTEAVEVRSFRVRRRDRLSDHGALEVSLRF